MHRKTFPIALENFSNCIGKHLQLHWKTFTIALENICFCIGKYLPLHWKTFTIALENVYYCIGNLLKLHWKYFTIALKSCKNKSKILQKYIQNPSKFEFENSVKAAFVSYCYCIRNLEKSTAIELERKHVLYAVHHNYSESLHTFYQCKKYSESTVGTRTHVKPVFFTVDLFAVYKNKDNISQGRPMSPAISPESEKDIFRRFAVKFNLVFHFLGEWYEYAIGLLFVTALLAGFCGCTRRMCWEIKYVGCTPMIIMTACQGIWTVARMPYHMWRGAATAPATVAQKGTHFDFEDVPLTGNGLTEPLTRSPPPPYNPSFKERLSNRWRQWRQPAQSDQQNNGDPSAPDSPTPSNPDVIHSPKVVHLTNRNKLASSDTSSSMRDTVITQPSGFQRFIPGGSNDRCSNMDSINDTCPYPDVDKAGASDYSFEASPKVSIEDDQANAPHRNLSIRQRAWYQRRYGNIGIQLTSQQLNALVKDSTESVHKAILSMPDEIPSLRRPDSLPMTAKTLSPPADNSSDTSDVPIYIKDHINKN